MSQKAAAVLRQLCLRASLLFTAHDDDLSWLQVWKRTSVLTTVWNYVYDHLLCDILRPGEAFIDFIAVSEKARYAAAQYRLDGLYMQGLYFCDLFLSGKRPAQTGLYPSAIRVLTLLTLSAVPREDSHCCKSLHAKCYLNSGGAYSVTISTAAFHQWSIMISTLTQ